MASQVATFATQTVDSYGQHADKNLEELRAKFAEVTEELTNAEQALEKAKNEAPARIKAAQESKNGEAKREVEQELKEQEDKVNDLTNERDTLDSLQIHCQQLIKRAEDLLQARIEYLAEIARQASIQAYIERSLGNIRNADELEQLAINCTAQANAAANEKKIVRDLPLQELENRVSKLETGQQSGWFTYEKTATTATTQSANGPSPSYQSDGQASSGRGDRTSLFSNLTKRWKQDSSAQPVNNYGEPAPANANPGYGVPTQPMPQGNPNDRERTEPIPSEIQRNPDGTWSVRDPITTARQAASGTPSTNPPGKALATR